MAHQWGPVDYVKNYMDEMNWRLEEILDEMEGVPDSPLKIKKLDNDLASFLGELNHNAIYYQVAEICIMLCNYLLLILLFFLATLSFGFDFNQSFSLKTVIDHFYFHINTLSTIGRGTLDIWPSEYNEYLKTFMFIECFTLIFYTFGYAALTAINVVQMPSYLQSYLPRYCQQMTSIYAESDGNNQTIDFETLTQYVAQIEPHEAGLDLGALTRIHAFFARETKLSNYTFIGCSKNSKSRKNIKEILMQNSGLAHDESEEVIDIVCQNMSSCKRKLKIPFLYLCLSNVGKLDQFDC